MAITLWVLATPSEYHSVAHLFGIARCTVCIIVSKTIAKKLEPLYVSFPLGMGDIDILVSDYCKASISQLSRLLI